MGMALTGKVVPYKTGFGPFPGSIYHVPAPVALHGVTVDDSLRAIDQLFKADIDPEQVAAIIIEPIQGEGGFYVVPPEFMRALREICDRHGIVLIADEIQTGFARTGKMFAMQHYDVLPGPHDDGQEPGRRGAAVGGMRPRRDHGRARARWPGRHLRGQRARDCERARGARRDRGRAPVRTRRASRPGPEGAA